MDHSTQLARCFLDATPAESRSRWEDDPKLPDTLRSLLKAARERWPGVSVSDADFLRYLGERAPEAPVSLRSLNAADLFLACACAAGDPLALVEFETGYICAADGALSRLDVPTVVADEAKQALRERLLVTSAEKPAKITAFAGRGDLLSWVRVSAVRLALEIHRKRGKERLVGDEALAAISEELDPQSEYLRRHYRQHIGVVFREALASLSPKDRNALRYHYIKGLTLDQIGAIYNIHRSSASRRLARARERLLRETRVRLIARLEIGRATADSILRMLQSQIGESVRRAFGTTESGGDSRG